MFHVLRGRQWGASAHSYSVVKDPRHCTGCAFWVGRSAFFQKVVDGPMAWNHDIPKGTIWLQFPGASLEQNIGVELPWKSVELQWLLVLTGQLNQCHLIAVPVYLGEAAAFDRSLFDPDSLQQDHSPISHSQVKQILMHVDAIMLYISFFIHLS